MVFLPAIGLKQFLSVALFSMICVLPAVPIWGLQNSGSGYRKGIPAEGHLPSGTEVSRGIVLSANYLKRACDVNGKFLYSVTVDSGRISSEYNITRHAGAMYSLAMFNRLVPDAKAVDAMVRAGKFMRTVHMDADKSRKDMLVVWAKPVAWKGPREAYLGASGLGLVALAEVKRVRPGAVSLSDLQAMGRFLVFLQKSDGSFYHKYNEESGPVDNYQELYYPGEAALGLISLYELDHRDEWLIAAGKALSYLAQSRAGSQDVPPDDWALIATAKLLPYCQQTKCAASQQEMIRHAVQICEVLLRRQIISRLPEIDGGFSPDGATSPAATSLEGLLAAWEFLPNDQQDLRDMIEGAAREGVKFLLRAQIKSGPYAGGIPITTAGGSGNAVRHDPAASEIRIDLVQHALCALLRYEQLKRNGKLR
jgi:hypothetical protein